MEKKTIEQIKEDVQNGNFNFNDLILLDDFKWVLKSILESGGNEEWKADLIEFINSDTSDNANAFFYNMLPFVRFINEPASESAGFTAPDHRIYLNAPQGFGVGSEEFKWEFIYFHECLHQLWDTFDVEKNIERQFGSCDHDILNIASDCVINDFLHINKKMPYPIPGLITPEYIKDNYGVEYDRKRDTQFGLYEKLMKVADQIHKSMPQPQPNDNTQHQPSQSGQSGKSSQSGQSGQSGQSQSGQSGQSGQSQSGQSGQSGQSQSGQSGQSQSGQSGQSGQSQSGQSGQSGQGGGQNQDGSFPDSTRGMDGADSADGATQAADAAEHAADRAQQAADKAAASGNNDAAKKAQKAADKAKKAAEAARDAADKAQEAAMDGNDATAKKEAKKAIDKAKEAISAANEAEQIAKEANGETGSNGNNQQNSKSNGGGGGGYSHGYEGLKDLDEPTSDYWKKLGDSEIKKFAGKISGAFGDFVKKCKVSEKEEKKEGVVVRARRGGAWNKVLKKKVEGFIYQKVQDKRRETEPTYSRIKRGSRPVKFGQPIKPGTKIKEDKLNITVGFYIDRSGSMTGHIDTCFSLAYQIADKIRGEYKNEKVVGDIGMKFYAFDTALMEVQKGQTVPDGGCTMTVKELMELVETNTGEYLVNIIITDLETDIDKGAVTALVKKMPGMCFIISNQPKHEAECRDIERACKGKFVYLLASSDWEME